MTRHHRALVAPLSAALPAGLLLAAPARAAEGLELVPEPSRLIALLVLFVLLVPVLDRLLFRPLLAVLAERDQRIEGARTRASELSRRAAALVAQHDEALRQAREASQREHMSAVDEARRAHQVAIGEARGAAERQLAATRAEVGAALDAARAGLRSEAEPLAREVAARLLGRSLS